jgi:D-cysteine desulfhydrase
MGVPFDRLVAASGSGGTHAGLVAGLHGVHANLPLTGVSVRAEKVAQEEKIHALAQAVADLMGIGTPVPRELVEVVDAYVGPGYSLPTGGDGGGGAALRPPRGHPARPRLHRQDGGRA